MSNTPLLIQNLNTELRELLEKNDWEQVKRVILSVIKFLDKEVDLNNESLFSLFTDGDGKVRANATWFFEDFTLADRKATYKIHPNNNLGLDFKLYGLNKPSKRTISWVQALTPNFEDEPFNSKFNIGIDFIVPKTLDKVIVVLSNNYVVRTLELKGELSVTYQEIFDKWLKISDFSNKKEAHNVLWESFDLQPLNKKFYAGISERFLELRQHLINNKILDEKHSSMFSNRLIGRIIFCWFIDKKNILNPENKYFDSNSFKSATEYYNDRLEKLFFEVLNTPIEERVYTDKVTPFLNGGLFEPRVNDLYHDDKLTFPTNFFDSLFAFLSGYNFTTDESTSQFQQVAIDPEMLGRIFENLLAEINEDTGEQARKAKGAFYTPREIVDYMCKESLKEYLKTKLPEEEFRDQRLFQLIDAPEKDFQDQDHNWRRDWKPYKDQIIKALDELTVIDIACGSGAFPIGMMQLLLKVYERLEARFDPYETKLQIIEQNIFGVDIEPMAVEIARLRAWLSIVVDEEADSKNIKPLPNLEFKFVCANSLISLDSGKNETQTFFDDPYLDEKLQKIRDSYFKTEDQKKKKKLREEYSTLVEGASSLFGESKRSKQLKTYKPFDNESSANFFDANFMFGVDSFEILIGNPPYVQLQKNNGELANTYKGQMFESFARSGDLYTLFYEKGLHLLAKSTGILTYITSNKWMKTAYGEKLRSLFLNYNLIKLIDLGEKIFDTAMVDTNILIVNKSDPKFAKKPVLIAYLLKNNGKETLLKELEKEPISIQFSNSKPWTIGNTRELALRNSLENSFIKLATHDIKINYGIKTGYNKAFIINTETYKQLIEAEPSLIQVIKPVLGGSDLEKYYHKWRDSYLIFIPWHFPLHEDSNISGASKKAEDLLQNCYPVLYRYLLQHKDKLAKRNQSETGVRYEWYALQRCAATYKEEFSKEKVAWLNLNRKWKFSYVEKDIFVEASLNFLSSNKFLKFYCGILSSKLHLWYFKQVGRMHDRGGFMCKIDTISNLPVPSISERNMKLASQIDDLVGNIIYKSKNSLDFTNEEDALNLLVYKYYELSEDQIKVIDESLD